MTSWPIYEPCRNNQQREEDPTKSLSLNGFRKRMEMYGRACEDSDPRVAADLFAQNAAYFGTPFDDPMVGRDAIYRYWSKASRALKDIRLSYEILAVKGNAGMALWQGKFVSVKSGNHVVLDGVFLAEFDEQEKCHTFREGWHRQELGASPFEADASQ